MLNRPFAHAGRAIEFLFISVGLLAIIGCSSSENQSFTQSPNPTPISSSGDTTVQTIPQIFPTTMPTMSGATPAAPTVTVPTKTPINHPLVTGHTPAPLNLPSVEVTPKPPETVVPRLTPGGFPEVILVTNGQFLNNGIFEGSGQVTISENSIHITTDLGDTAQIMYQLPTAMTDLLNNGFRGSISLMTYKNIAVTRIHVRVSDQTGLIFAYTTDTGSDLLTVKITDAVTLEQSDPGLQQDQLSVNIPTFVRPEGLLDEPIEAGSLARINLPAGLLEMYLESSYWSGAMTLGSDTIAHHNITVWAARAAD